MKIYMEKCTHEEVASMLLETHKSCRRNGCRDLKFKMVGKTNILHAFQRAENGQLIRNHRMGKNSFFKYDKQGLFWQYVMRDGKPECIGPKTQFYFADIIDLSWETVEEP